ncbi:MAG TPA: hypothetical protein VFI47_22805 [Acidimicrobiales bacterium]|nr:hypothetical protein [Acidimicrobiales bacterium]
MTGPGTWPGGATPTGPSPGRRGGAAGPATWVGVGAAAVLVAVGGFVAGRALTAGGGDVPSADRAPLDRDRVIEIIDDGVYENLEGALDQDESRCIARDVVGSLGHERFVELGVGGVNPYSSFGLGELTEEEERTYTEAFYGCIADERLADYVASVDIASGVDPSVARCRAEAQVGTLGAARMREILVEGVVNPDTPPADLFEGGEEEALNAALVACEAPAPGQ